MSDPFHHNPRKSMSAQRMARIFASRHGKCGQPDLGEKDWGCGRKLGPADYWQIEHNPALENGGQDENDDQCFVICEWCLSKKNADDHSLAAQSRNRYVNHYVPKEYRRSRSWGRR